MSVLGSTSGWVVVGTLAAVGALAVALATLLVNVIKSSGLYALILVVCSRRVWF